MTEKQLIINVDYGETRIALLDEGNLSEIFIERNRDLGLVGNIFKGIVTRVLPGMNSAFIDIGTEKSAFLFGGDVWDPENEDNYSPRSEDDSFSPVQKRPIEKILKDGQEIVVQIAKEPLGSKGPRVTMFLTLPGRYLVYMPNIKHVGISRRIEDESERNRLKSIVEDLLPANSGIIIRTAAVNANRKDIEKDFDYLMKASKLLKKAVSNSRPPSLVHKDLDVIQKITRDLYSEEVQDIIIDDVESYKLLENFLKISVPGAQSKLVLHEELIPIFDVYGIDIDIASALSARADLPSGGYLIIEQTEALTSFDVNTGKFVGNADARQTIIRTNIEATKKVVEQLKVRNIGGIIVIDFIDMADLNDREKIYNLLIEELKADRARTNVLKVSELGLVQMTRKRTSESLERKLLSACHFCNGKGQIKSIETEAYDLLREIHRSHLQSGSKAIKVRLKKNLQQWIDENATHLFDQVQKRFDLQISYETSELTEVLLREPQFEVFC